MRAKEYEVLHRAVEEGATYRARRFWKHREDTPPPYLDELVEAVVQGVVDSVCEWFVIADQYIEKSNEG